MELYRTAAETGALLFGAELTGVTRTHSRPPNANATHNAANQGVSESHETSAMEAEVGSSSSSLQMLLLLWRSRGIRAGLQAYREGR